VPSVAGASLRSGPDHPCGVAGRDVRATPQVSPGHEPGAAARDRPGRRKEPDMSVTSQAAERPTRRRRWTAVAAAAGALWSVGYLALWLGWLAGVGANPADPAVEPAAELTLPGLLGPTAGAALLTVLSVVGLAVAVASFRLQRRADGAARAVGWAAVVLGLVLAVGMPDYRVLAVLGYAPIVLVMALAG